MSGKVIKSCRDFSLFFSKFPPKISKAKFGSVFCFDFRCLSFASDFDTFSRLPV